MNLNGIYLSAVKLSIIFTVFITLACALCMVLGYPLPTPLAYIVVTALYLMLTPSVLMHLPIANGEILPLPSSALGWTLGLFFMLFMLFVVSITMILVWRFWRRKQ